MLLWDNEQSRASHVCLFLHRLVAVLLSPILFVPPCYCSSSWVLLGIGILLVSHALTSLSMWLCVLRVWRCLGPVCALVLVPLLVSPSLPLSPSSLSLSFSFSFSLSLSLSLSLAVLLSRCLLWTPESSSSSKSSSYTCRPCSLQVVVLNPFSPLLFFSQSVLARMDFLASYISLNFCLPLFRSPCSSVTCCARLCSVCFGTKPIVRYIPLASVSTTFPAYLPTCLQLVSLSSLHYRASFRGLQHLGWRGKRFSSFLSFLTCSSSLSQCFFTFLLITVILSGCFWDPRFSLSPMCSPLCPYWANFLLLAVSV